MSIASPLTRPSPNGRRVGIRIVTKRDPDELDAKYYPGPAIIQWRAVLPCSSAFTRQDWSSNLESGCGHEKAPRRSRCLHHFGYFCPRNLPLKGGGLNMGRRTQLNAVQALEAAERLRRFAKL